MDDARKRPPDHECLLGVASTQHGFFTATQARACGFGTDLLPYHARTGRFVRIYQGVYRLRDYPSSEHEPVVAAWLAIGRGVAVVSHESALALHDLTDDIPSIIHLTVPRSHRYLLTLPHVRLHTTTRPLEPADVVVRDGVRATAPIRTLLDVAEAGTGPERIEIAIRQAVRRSLLLPDKLSAAAHKRSARVQAFVNTALDRVRA